MSDRRSRGGRAAAISLGILLALPALLFAHIALRGSSPAADAVLDRVPRDLRLIFTERPEIAISAVELLAPDDAPVRLGQLHAAADSPHVLVAEILGPLREGRHVVRWRTAMADGHPVRGSFAFTILEGATGSSRSSPSDSVRRAEPASRVQEREGAFDTQSAGYVGVRWLSYLALMLALGAPLFAVLILPRAWTAGDEPSSFIPIARERVRRAGLVAACALLLLAAARLTAQAIALYGRAGAMDPELLGTMLTRTSWGEAWIAQTLACLLLVGALLLAKRSPGAGWTLAIALSLPLAMATAFGGHAASAESGALLAVGVDALHVLGVSAWLGGLAMLVLAAIPATRESGGPARVLIGSLVNAFSPIALTCGILVVSSGTISALLRLDTLDELASSNYGRTLMIKVALVIFALAAGAYNWRRVRPAFTTSDAGATLKRVAATELAVAVLIVLVTAVLVATPLPGEP